MEDVEREKERNREGGTPTDIQIASGIAFASYRRPHDFTGLVAF